MVLAAPALPAEERLRAAIDRGDAAWASRAEGRSGLRASAEPIGRACGAYEEALALQPGSLEARWKLMRALFYLGEHVETDRETQLEVFDRGRQIGEEGIYRIGATVGGRKRLFEMSSEELRTEIPNRTESAEIFFWSAVQTGLWGRTRGKLAAAREGVAGKIRDYAAISIALDPTIENGGGHRVLGRLHTEAPKIPFITGWIDRSLAISELETCHRISPRDLTTQLYLAEALIEFAPKRKDEGIEMLRAVVESETDPRWLVEELKAQDDARVLLAPLTD